MGGMKWLYAHTYYTKDEFWAQFNREWHEKLRRKYKADGALPEVYDKVHVDIEKYTEMTNKDWGMRMKSVWPLGGFWGIWKSIQSKDYLLHRNATWRWRG
jgi:delta24-sterol reductase